LLRPYPHFTSIQSQSVRWAQPLRFNSIQGNARFANSFSMTAAYAITKQIERTRFLNDQDTELVKEISEFDVPQRFVMSTVYELPFGPGKKYFSSSKGFTGRLVEGMQLNVMYQAQGGIPIAITGRSRRRQREAGQERAEHRALVQYDRVPATASHRAGADVAPARCAQRRAEQLRYFVFQDEAVDRGDAVAVPGGGVQCVQPAGMVVAIGAFGTAVFWADHEQNTFARQLQFALKLIW
jgi:hypothetical protein